MEPDNESGIDSAERHLWDMETRAQFGDAPEHFVCFGCGAYFSDDEMERGGECPKCGCDDIEEWRD
jgi:predicted Zn-ribbon and HTH transcriptional regulator